MSEIYSDLSDKKSVSKHIPLQCYRFILMVIKLIHFYPNRHQRSQQQYGNYDDNGGGGRGDYRSRGDRVAYRRGPPPRAMRHDSYSEPEIEFAGKIFCIIKQPLHLPSTYLQTQHIFVLFIRRSRETMKQ